MFKVQLRYKLADGQRVVTEENGREEFYFEARKKSTGRRTMILPRYGLQMKVTHGPVQSAIYFPAEGGCKTSGPLKIYNLDVCQ